ncbi:MAG: hypothetical protein RR614_07930 [Eubacterium sp.]
MKTKKINGRILLVTLCFIVLILSIISGILKQEGSSYFNRSTLNVLSMTVDYLNAAVLFLILDYVIYTIFQSHESRYQLTKVKWCTTALLFFIFGTLWMTFSRFPPFTFLATMVSFFYPLFLIGILVSAVQLFCTCENPK